MRARGGFTARQLTAQPALAQRAIHIWSREDGSVRRVTGEMWNERSPVWDPAGDYLFYLSKRELCPQPGSFELNYAVNRPTQVYALALRADVEHPFPSRSDEVAREGEAGDDEAEDGESGDDETEDDDGGDPQLEKAIEVLLEKVKSDPKRLPDRKPGPVKTPKPRQ